MGSLVPTGILLTSAAQHTQVPMLGEEKCMSRMWDTSAMLPRIPRSFLSPPALPQRLSMPRSDLIAPCLGSMKGLFCPQGSLPQPQQKQVTILTPAQT